MLPPKNFVNQDPWLKPYESAIESRLKYISSRTRQLLDNKSIDEFALGHLYYGLHKTESGWIFREWAPNATEVYLVGDFNGWQDNESFRLKSRPGGVFELEITHEKIVHQQKYKLHIYWPGGDGYRMPSYTTRAVQDPETHNFDAQVWQPTSDYRWRHKSPPATSQPPVIYEAHIGMSGQDPEVASYRHFTKNILPRIQTAGYNTVQLMAVQEHPYYGSYGYHVSNLFAASSRYGTPEELKSLIDTAHSLGLRVILDIVHSHAIKNENEGLAKFDGTANQYFHAGERGQHIAWDSLCYDYGKPEVVHYLLSNCRYWLDEYKFDGFRFDGVTSMLYSHHGLAKAFTSYDDYFTESTDNDALTYLSLANSLIHTVNKNAITIAEEMSALPGLAAPTDEGGIGFDYRMSMGVPDIWIKTLEEKRDEDWNLAELFHELTTHRPEEKVISYSESHDQALVGDKTLIFRLIDKEMYDHMSIDDSSLVVERGISLLKLIRLFTAATHGGGYLNFMGNEFGHPEWIDFPREGNNWSYQYARRQWNLADDPKLKYQWLKNFDQAMIEVVKNLGDTDFEPVTINQNDLVISFIRSGYLFAFNFSPEQSYTDYSIKAPDDSYEIVFSSDDMEFGGQSRIDNSLNYPSTNGRIQLYLPARTCVVFRRSV